MKDAAKFNLEGVEPLVDPTTGSGNIFLMPEGMGSDGKPFVFQVQDPPHKTRPRHYHHGDVLYVYTHGEPFNYPQVVWRRVRRQAGCP